MLQLVLQPFGPFLILALVADEGEILESVFGYHSLFADTSNEFRVLDIASSLDQAVPSILVVNLCAIIRIDDFKMDVLEEFSYRLADGIIGAFVFVIGDEIQVYWLFNCFSVIVLY